MAIYTIEHTCGHVEKADIVGKVANRASRARYLASLPCPACREAERAAEVAQANVGLPALVGTPNQIAWAEKLRAKSLERMDDFMMPFMPSDEKIAMVADRVGITVAAARARFERVVSGVEEARNKLYTETDCRWWIDNLHTDPERWLQSVKTRLNKESVADVTERELAAKREEEEARAQAAAEARAVEAAAESAVRDVVATRTKALVDFEPVSFRRLRGDREYADFEVVSADGRSAKGYVDHGEHVVYMLDGESINSHHPAAETLAAQAKDRIWRED